MIEAADTLRDAVLTEAIAGLSARPKTLPPWLFYDEAGSALFEKITELPEYYLTRAERSIFAERADEIVNSVGPSAHHRRAWLRHGVEDRSAARGRRAPSAQGPLSTH